MAASVHKSATREQTIRIEEAEDRGFDAGREYGMELRATMDIAFLEREGFREAADALQKARVVEAKPAVE